jgi:hypothetical protein
MNVAGGGAPLCVAKGEFTFVAENGDQANATYTPVEPGVQGRATKRGKHHGE